MNDIQIEKNVIGWYSQQQIWEANAKSASKKKDSIDYKLLDVDSMIVGKKVLNLGCCYPVDEIQLSDKAEEWIAIDFSLDVIRRCEKTIKRENLSFRVMNMRQLVFPDAYFDTVLDFSSGDHLSEHQYQETLAEVYRVLRPGGFFVVTYSNFNVFHKKDNYGSFGYWRCDTPEEMKVNVQEAGFSIINEADPSLDRTGLVATK